MGRALTPTIKPMLQRTCACGGTPGPTGECAQCRKKWLQRQATPRASVASAPPLVHQVLQAPGSPLGVASRRTMESRFGHNFGQVRIHTDTQAAESAQQVNALAYTVGQHIVFGAGRYAPQTVSGGRLLAHELTHTLQQGVVGAVQAKEIGIGDVDDPLEQQAERAAARVVADPAPVTRTAQPPLPRTSLNRVQLQRQTGDAAPAGGAAPNVYLCSKSLDTSPIGKHAFFRMGGSAPGNRTYSLEPEDRGADCWQGQPMYDFPADFNAANATCERTALSASCLQSAFVRYPIGHYCTLGPNSNTFVGRLARECGLQNPDPPGWTPGIDDSPPRPGTFSPSPGSTLFDCSLKTCDASRDVPPDEAPV